MKKWVGGLLSIMILGTAANTKVFADEITEPKVKVKLVNYIGNKPQLTIKPTGDYTVENTNIHLTDGKNYVVKNNNQSVSLVDGTKVLYTSNDLNLVPGYVTNYLSINNRDYLGTFDFTSEKSAYVRPVNTVYMEDYLKGVVPFEMMASWNREALKAQAVAARTYAYSYNSKIINDTISYQVYGGYVWHENASAAVDETKGQVLKYNNRLISTVFSASNGGKTESNANAWGNTAVPYLPIKDDPYDSKTPWNISLHKIQFDPGLLTWSQMKETDTTLTTNIKSWMNANGYAGKEIKITGIPVLSLYAVTSGGRVSQGDITIDFITKDQTDGSGHYTPQTLAFKNVPASKVRAMVGIRTMLSYLVTSQTETDDTIIINGQGDGHGIGLSQWGAKNRADAGQSYQDILGFYYEGASLVTEYTHRIADTSLITVADTDKKVSASTTETKPIMWKGMVLKKGQIGRITVTKRINLWKRENNRLIFVRILNPNEIYRVYGYDSKYGGQYSLGGGYYITNMKGYIKYETPSKSVLAAANR